MWREQVGATVGGGRAGQQDDTVFRHGESGVDQIAG